jgi:hypothetical protein
LRIGQFHAARQILIYAKQKETFFGDASFYRRTGFDRWLQQFPASSFETEGRDDVLCDDDRDSGIEQASIAVEPCGRLELAFLVATIITVRHESSFRLQPDLDQPADST